MNLQKTRSSIIALATLSIMTPAAKSEGVVVLVKSRAAMDGNDIINWKQLGPPITTVPTPAAITSNGGISAMVSNLGGAGVGSERNGNEWGGNFAANAPILFTGEFVPSGAISITFAEPVYAAGAQMGYNWDGPPTPFPFTAIITAYDSENNLLGTFTLQGEQAFTSDNSAIFLGIRDSIPEISTIVFSTTTDAGEYPGSIAINNVTLAVPTGCATKRR
jgi:hypothetical protein